MNAQNDIISMNTYIGTGSGRNQHAADNNAIQDLIHKIAEGYSSVFSGLDDYLLNDPVNQSISSVVISTYNNYIETGSEREVLNDSPRSSVTRTMRADAIEQMFSMRKEKMYDMLKSAVKAEKSAKIDDALRYYNWAYYLLLSLPGWNTIAENGEKLIDMIPSRVDEILDKMSFAKRQYDSKSVILDVTYKSKPVTSVDYKYYDGKDWSNIYSAKDGVGVLDFRSKIPDEIQVKCECNFIEEAHIDRDVYSLVDVFCGLVSKNDIKAVDNVSNIVSDMSYNNNLGEIDFLLTNDYLERDTLPLLTDQESLPYKKRIAKVIAAIESGKYSSVDNLFSLNGLDIYNKLISYGKARIVDDRLSIKYTSLYGDVICRSVPMIFSFKNNNRQFVENVCFVFNSDTLIDRVSFGLDQRAEDDILSHKSWSEYARKILTEFLENYKTAYALKRIDYLRQIFDDDAYIIVGKVSQRPSQTDDAGQKYISNQYVQRYRKSKDEYMDQLERCFNSNEFINIRFAENDIEKAGKGGEVYGIQIKQDYYSTNYGDSGYLFLMVDLNDPQLPVIKVRVWMPERDPNFKGLPNFY